MKIKSCIIILASKHHHVIRNPLSPYYKNTQSNNRKLSLFLRTFIIAYSWDAVSCKYGWFQAAKYRDCYRILLLTSLTEWDMMLLLFSGVWKCKGIGNFNISSICWLHLSWWFWTLYLNRNRTTSVVLWNTIITKIEKNRDVFFLSM